MDGTSAHHANVIVSDPNHVEVVVFKDGMSAYRFRDAALRLEPTGVAYKPRH